MSAPVAIAAIGAFSPLGPSWVQTCASARAGLNRFAEHPWYQALTPDPGWDEADPLHCSMIPDWYETLDQPTRLTELAVEALGELLGRSSLRRAHLEQCGLVLALPSKGEVPGARDPSTGVVAHLLERTGLNDFALAKASEGGHAGFFAALQEAASAIRAGQLDYYIVGGVDSYLIDARLDALDQAWRLKTGRNPDGFVPGEAAVMLLLTTPRLANGLGIAPLCLLGEIALSREPETILGDRASTGTGLASAIATALGGGEPPAWVLCDLNGENYRAFEWGLVQARLASPLGEVKRLTHPADCLGDVGAVTGSLLMACVAHGFARGAAPAGRVLLWAGSDDGRRAAAVVNPPPERKQ